MSDYNPVLVQYVHGLVCAEKIDSLLPELSAAVASKDWDSAKRTTIKLKYLQGINAAAEAWPNRVHDH